MLSVLASDIKEYINLRIQLLTLTFTEKTAKSIASIISSGVLILLALLFLFFASFAAGFLLGSWLDSNALGFAIIAGFYLLLMLILLMIRKKRIEKPLTDKFINILLTKDNENE